MRVSGCDVAPNRLTRWLEGLGIVCVEGHDAAHTCRGVRLDAVIRTAAVPEQHEEIAAAVARGIPVYSRGEALAALVPSRGGIAVSGTHGKTTTTAMIAHILRAAGRDIPFCVGGEAPGLGGVAGGSEDSAGMVVEADESDGTVALYEPEVAVITNIEYDHMEHFSSVEEMNDCFHALAAHAHRLLVYGADDAVATRLFSGMPNARSFGFSHAAQVRAEDIRLHAESADFVLVMDGRRAGEFHLPVPGAYNIRNALAAATVGCALNLTPETVRNALAGYRAVRRRFETIFQGRGIRVISDYAHHPSEIFACLEAARGLRPRRLHVVFQPHRYTRTAVLLDDFPPAFEAADEIILTPVYAASEKPVDGGRSEDLYGSFERWGRRPVRLAANLDEAWTWLRGELAEGSLLVVVGAGDVEKLGFRISEELSKDRAER